MLDKIVAMRKILKFSSVKLRCVSSIALTLLLSACASSVVVKPDIPAPLVEQLDLKTSLVFTDTFKNYVYLENEKKRGSLRSLNFSDAQITMFNQVFSNLTTLVESDSGTQQLTIEPEILDFQYSSPSETKLKQYEIWIKYRIRLLNSDGDSIADWVIKGYGKTPTGLLTIASSAFNAATNIALRDVGAQLSIRFPKQKVVKTLVDGGTPRVIETKAEREQKIADAKIAKEEAARKKIAEAKAARERRAKEKAAKKTEASENKAKNNKVDDANEKQSTQEQSKDEQLKEEASEPATFDEPESE